MDEQTLPFDPPRIDIMLPKLSQAELMQLAEVLAIKQATFPAYCNWVIDLVIAEDERRKTPGAEPSMVEPPMWGPLEMADVLMASFVFLRSPLPERVHDFIEHLEKHVVASAAALLQQIGNQHGR